MKIYKINNHKYQLIQNYKEGFDLTEATAKLTDYFKSYDYIIGDWAYGKLRLKGFCHQDNTYCRSINDFNFKDDYIKNDCAHDCRYFILKKLPEEDVIEKKNE